MKVRTRVTADERGLRGETGGRTHDNLKIAAVMRAATHLPSPAASGRRRPFGPAALVFARFLRVSFLLFEGSEGCVGLEGQLIANR